MNSQDEKLTAMTLQSAPLLTATLSHHSKWLRSSPPLNKKLLKLQYLLNLNIT